MSIERPGGASPVDMGLSALTLIDALSISAWDGGPRARLSL